MNLRSCVIIEHVKNDHLYRLEIPVGVPYIEAHEASLEMAEMVVQMSKQAEEIAKKQAELDGKPLEPEVLEKSN